jgi:hypothetical protein
MEWPAVDDPVFGRLRWYADGRFYGGELLLGDGSELLVSLDPEDGEPGNDLGALLAAMLPSAHEALRWVLTNDERVRKVVAERSTDNYNGHWRDPDEEPEPISREEFADRIKLGSCWFYLDGRVELGYDDADMFGGHGIHVRCEPGSGRIEVGR